MGETGWVEEALLDVVRGASFDSRQMKAQVKTWSMQEVN
jgi:hypothetical protein